MLTKDRVTLIGAPPSPYTRKMIALLRYRHIPYEIIWGNPGDLLDAQLIQYIDDVDINVKGAFEGAAIVAPTIDKSPIDTVANDKLPLPSVFIN